VASAQQKAKPESKKSERNDKRRSRKAWSKSGPNGTRTSQVADRETGKVSTITHPPTFDANGVRLHGKGKKSGCTVMGYKYSKFLSMAKSAYPHLDGGNAVEVLKTELKRQRDERRRDAAARRRAGLPPIALVYRARKADEAHAAEQRRNGAGDGSMKVRLPKTKSVADKVQKSGLESVTVGEMREAMDEFADDFIATVRESSNN